MKTNVISAIICAGLLAFSCAVPEHPEIAGEEEGSNLRTLVMKGSIVGVSGREFPGVVDLDAGTVVIQVPYYMSDAEPIQGDLTHMKVSATMPVGARFEPSIAGVHDLLEGFGTTLVWADGSKTALSITAAYVKSDAAVLYGFPKNVAVTNFVREASEEGEKGLFSVLKTSDNIPLLEKAALSYSAWATLESEALNADGTVDLTKEKDITIVSQSGKVRRTYSIVFEIPATVDYGVSHIEALFGIQPLESDPQGFTKGANRTMAAVGSYLILSNCIDFTKMPVYDRFTGEFLGDNLVNTDGIEPTANIHGITNDDAGHLVAVTFVSNISGQETTNQIVYGYVWKNGIGSAPTCFMEANIGGGGWTTLPTATNRELFRNVTVRGDLTSGDAVVATVSKSQYRFVFVKVTDGSTGSSWPAKAEWIPGTNFLESLWNSTGVALYDNNYDDKTYIWTNGNFRGQAVYVKGNTSFGFDVPKSHWWTGSGTYDHAIWGCDHIEFNGAHLLALQSVLYEAGKTREGANQGYTRLYVADITASPTASSLTDGFIFDSREGGVDGTDGIPGTGYAPTGMTSAFAFSGGTVLGPNANETGDVLFVRGADGYSVQVYMLSTDQGLLGYNLTCLR